MDRDGRGKGDVRHRNRRTDQRRYIVIESLLRPSPGPCNAAGRGTVLAAADAQHHVHGVCFRRNGIHPLVCWSPTTTRPRTSPLRILGPAPSDRQGPPRSRCCRACRAASRSRDGAVPLRAGLRQHHRVDAVDRYTAQDEGEIEPGTTGRRRDRRPPPHRRTSPERAPSRTSRRTRWPTTPAKRSPSNGRSGASVSSLRSMMVVAPSDLRYSPSWGRPVAATTV